MSLPDSAFWIALLEIIGVNIVLSGDNAVVIALACRALPSHQQKKAILFGSLAAIVLRVILTAVAVELLKMPYLKLFGSILLLWIGIKLQIAEEEEAEGRHAHESLAGAIRTILIADLVMSLDNVIAVAAAAKGSMLLLILGLGFSIPIIVFGSTLLLKAMERFPIIITFGAALLGYVAGEMAIDDPAIKQAINTQAAFLHAAVPFAGILLVIGIGHYIARHGEKT